MARLIDTSTFIELERRQHPFSVLVADAPDDLFAMSSITASELLVGVERADLGSRRSRRQAFVESILRSVPVVPFELDVARVHARIWAELETSGRRIGPHDLIVAATAMLHGYDVVTFNVREFERVPGLIVRRPAW